jgi:transposase
MTVVVGNLERTWVGLDVHLSSISGAAIVGTTGELVRVRLGGEPEGALAWVASLPGMAKAVTYEAGPMGFGLARALLQAGHQVLVCAPGMVPRAPRDRIKTDRRDAERLARLLMAGQLSGVRVPSVAEEGLRDLVRAREDLRRDLMACRHRITKSLLRHGVRHPSRYGRWSRDHRIWLGRLQLADPAAQMAFLDQLGVYDFLLARRGQLESQLFARVAASEHAQTAARLRCLRGIERLTAAGLVAEIGDFARFASAPRLMSYLGLVPAEESSGPQRRLGRITKTGSSHARRLLIEAAWNYRHPPRRNSELAARQKGQPPGVIARSWQTQLRLHRVWSRHEARGKRSTLTAVAVARELAGACWAVALM